MKPCMICKKQRGKLYSGMCAECMSEGANVSLLSAIRNEDKEMQKMIDRRVEEGKIVRLI